MGRWKQGGGVPVEADETTPRSFAGNGPSSDVVCARHSDDDDDDDIEHANVSRLLEGLRCGDGTPPPAVSRPGSRGEDERHGIYASLPDEVQAPEARRDGSQEPIASAPFHSHAWINRATLASAAAADVPCEELGDEGRIVRTEAAAMDELIGHFAESDVAV